MDEDRFKLDGPPERPECIVPRVGIFFCHSKRIILGGLFTVPAKQCGGRRPMATLGKDFGKEYGRPGV